jgi:hypothetical protein
MIIQKSKTNDDNFLINLIKHVDLENILFLFQYSTDQERRNCIFQKFHSVSLEVSEMLLDKLSFDFIKQYIQLDRNGFNMLDSTLLNLLILFRIKEIDNTNPKTLLFQLLNLPENATLTKKLDNEKIKLILNIINKYQFLIRFRNIQKLFIDNLKWILKRKKENDLIIQHLKILNQNELKYKQEVRKSIDHHIRYVIKDEQKQKELNTEFEINNKL